MGGRWGSALPSYQQKVDLGPAVVPNPPSTINEPGTTNGPGKPVVNENTQGPLPPAVRGSGFSAMKQRPGSGYSVF